MLVGLFVSVLDSCSYQPMHNIYNFRKKNNTNVFMVQIWCCSFSAFSSLFVAIYKDLLFCMPYFLWTFVKVILRCDCKEDTINTTGAIVLDVAAIIVFFFFGDKIHKFRAKGCMLKFLLFVFFLCTNFYFFTYCSYFSFQQNF